MKIPTSALVGALFLAGLLCGMAGRRFLQSRVSESPPQLASSSPRAKPVAEGPATNTMKNRSDDTVETLLALDERELYGRIAHWLLDASEEELIEFRNAYQQAGAKDYEVGRLTLESSGIVERGVRKSA